MEIQSHASRARVLVQQFRSHLSSSKMPSEPPPRERNLRRRRAIPQVSDHKCPVCMTSIAVALLCGWPCANHKTCLKCAIQMYHAAGSWPVRPVCRTGWDDDADERLRGQCRASGVSTRARPTPTPRQLPASQARPRTPNINSLHCPRMNEEGDDEDCRMVHSPNWSPTTGWQHIFTCLACGFELNLDFTSQNFYPPEHLPSRSPRAHWCRLHGAMALVINYNTQAVFFTCCMPSFTGSDTHHIVAPWLRQSHGCPPYQVIEWPAHIQSHVSEPVDVITIDDSQEADHSPHLEGPLGADDFSRSPSASSSSSASLPVPAPTEPVHVFHDSPALHLRGTDAKEAACLQILSSIADGSWQPTHEHASLLGDGATVTDCMRILGRSASAHRSYRVS